MATRYAKIKSTQPDAVADYLPSGYKVIAKTSRTVWIEGEDDHGWTLDGYVLPRLASGLHFGVETDVHGKELVK